jgi:hypothetical protein
LDHVRFKAPEPGTLRQVGKTQRHLVMNGEFRSLRPGRFAALTGLLIGTVTVLRRRRQNTGTDLGTRLLSLEHSNLIAQFAIGFFQFGNPVRQLPKNPQQRLNQRRPVVGPNLGKLDLHASQSMKPFADQLRQIFRIFEQLLRLPWETV